MQALASAPVTSSSSSSSGSRMQLVILFMGATEMALQVFTSFNGAAGLYY
jgi:hypothetical protein